MNNIKCVVGRPLNSIWLGRTGSCQSFAMNSNPVGPRVAVFRWDDGETYIKCIQGDGRPDGSSPFKEYEVLKFEFAMDKQDIEAHVVMMAKRHFDSDITEFKYAGGMIIVRT